MHTIYKHLLNHKMFDLESHLIHKSFKFPDLESNIFEDNLSFSGGHGLIIIMDVSDDIGNTFVLDYNVSSNDILKITNSNINSTKLVYVAILTNSLTDDGKTTFTLETSIIDNISTRAIFWQATVDDSKRLIDGNDGNVGLNRLFDASDNVPTAESEIIISNNNFYVRNSSRSGNGYGGDYVIHLKTERADVNVYYDSNDWSNLIVSWFIETVGPLNIRFNLMNFIDFENILYVIRTQMAHLQLKCQLIDLLARSIQIVTLPSKSHEVRYNLKALLQNTKKKSDDKYMNRELGSVMNKLTYLYVISNDLSSRNNDSIKQSQFDQYNNSENDQKDIIIVILLPDLFVQDKKLLSNSQKTLDNVSDLQEILIGSTIPSELSPRTDNTIANLGAVVTTYVVATKVTSLNDNSKSKSVNVGDSILLARNDSKLGVIGS